MKDKILDILALLPLVIVALAATVCIVIHFIKFPDVFLFFCFFLFTFWGAVRTLKRLVDYEAQDQSQRIRGKSWAQEMIAARKGV